MMRYGIPKYRLPREVLDAEIARILDLGVRLELGARSTTSRHSMESGSTARALRPSGPTWHSGSTFPRPTRAA